jgi:hypothetical protein
MDFDRESPKGPTCRNQAGRRAAVEVAFSEAEKIESLRPPSSDIKKSNSLDDYWACKHQSA